MNRPAVLNIFGDDGTYLFVLSLAGAEQPKFGPGYRTYQVKIDPRAARVLCQRMSTSVDAANDDPHYPGIAIDPFVKLGKGLYDYVLVERDTRELRDQLNNLDSPLLIVTDEPGMHWELMTTGDRNGFLCLKHSVGRSLKGCDVPSFWPPRSRDKKWRCLIIADPEGNLPAALSEAKSLRAGLEKAGVKCDFLTGAEASFDAVVVKLLDEYDIIHYAGHAVADAIQLHDGSFSCENIRRFVKGTPIVFVNGCDSAQAVGGLANAFIVVGARVVVGSMFKAPDDGARAFAEHFYQLVLQGEAIGEAMRSARTHVMDNQQWGAAWACFVMYGDPCLRIGITTDELQTWLHAMGLSRDDFDAPAGRVIDRAFAYGSPNGSVDTAHLFAAMVGGEDPFLRERLQEKDIPPEALEAAFKETFKAVSSSIATSGTSPKASGNTQAILKCAKSLLKPGTPPSKISELDLVRAFVRVNDGATVAVLKSLDAPIEHFDPDAVGYPDAGVPPVRTEWEDGAMVSAGPLSEDNCSAAGWSALLAASGAAARTGHDEIGTPHLFEGLRQVEGGALSKALERLGFETGTPPPSAKRGARLNGEVRCSRNTMAILQDALADATLSHAGVSDHHILGAFVRARGGQMGVALAQQGIILESLTSPLFSARGELDLARLDAECRAIFDEAVTIAGRNRLPAVGRQQVICGALRLAGSHLTKWVRSQGRDPDLLADLMLTDMPMGQSPPLATPAIRNMTVTLVAMLCRAEMRARERQAQRIAETDLLCAWLAGGGEAARFLIQNGVKTRGMIDDCEFAR